MRRSVVCPTDSIEQSSCPENGLARVCCGLRVGFRLMFWRRLLRIAPLNEMFARTLRWFALFVAVGALIWWIAGGANRGWTKTSVPVKRTDEVTGISVDDYQKRFVPGLDFLAAPFTGAAVLAGISLFLNKKRPTPL